MYSPRLYKYRDSSVLYTPIVQITVPYHRRTLFWYRHTHMTFPPPDISSLQTLRGYNADRIEKNIKLEIMKKVGWNRNKEIKNGTSAKFGISK